MKADTTNIIGKENKAQASSPDAKQLDYKSDEILPLWVLERIAKSQTDIAEGRTVCFLEFKKRLSIT
ncbi:hypothetical protein ACRQ5D_04330 [Mucilaginibacter sp. P25]|uniref:Uncharacterized protein n=1 Tax=Mucilaginibacter gossypii TaxID=551996 RepID=A0A1G8F9Y7_9SPHI|nr:hypothetical protein [Mucilaginibacter gossypii]SDH78966.1 hypothetical protein SAMN05192573_112203 [Mucilaginibacter gossypii]